MKTKLGGVGVLFTCFWLVSIAHAQPVATNAASQTALLPDGDPLVRSWVPPVYPPELKEAKVTGDVMVWFIVDDKGTVRSVRAVKSSDPRFEAAAVAAVQQWAFEPGVEEGAPVAMGMGVRLHFKLPEAKQGLLPPRESTPKHLSKSEAKASSPPNPDYPPDLQARQIGGEAVVDLVVEADGRITGVRLLGVNHPGFVRPVLAAAEKLTFTPAKQGDLPVRAKIRTSMEFQANVVQVDETIPSQLALNGFSLRLAEVQTERELCDKRPEIWTVPDVMFPRMAAIEGRAGEATVSFDLTERGYPENIQIVAASSPEFGERLVDTLSAGGFKPAMKQGRTVALPMQWTHVFALPSDTPQSDESSEARLIRILRSGETIPTAKGLDAPLKPLWRVGADYPAELRAEALAGTAQVELIIDREGRVRLPQVVSATHEKFGRAAVIAASLWVFDPPTRGGNPVDVRVRLPFQFSP